MKINFRQPRLTEDEHLAIVNDYNAGMKVDEILKKHNIGKMRLYRLLKKEDMAERPEDYEDEPQF